MTINEAPLFDAVKQALGMVIDPELGENLVDLGLIYGIAVEDGVAHVEMTTTTRGCPATAYLADAVRSAARSVPRVHHVEVKLTYEPAWTPEMMNDAAKARIASGMRPARFNPSARLPRPAEAASAAPPRSPSAGRS